MLSSNGYTLAKVTGDDRLTLMEQTTIGGHRALVNDFPGGLSCVVSIDVQPGVLEFMVGYKIDDFETADQACDQAVNVATAMAPYFPEHL